MRTTLERFEHESVQTLRFGGRTRALLLLPAAPRNLVEHAVHHPVEVSMKRWLQIASLIGFGLLSVPVRALDQFLLVDATYTATTQNTSDSHYRVEPNAGTPSNWRSPVDYTGGKAYVHLDVLEKPGSAKTIYNVC